MPFYYRINTVFADPEVRKRVATNLLALRKQLAVEVPPRTTTETLLLATWNIREFDSAKYGRPRCESLYYIAEILSHFDLIAVQEVRDDLTALEETLKIMGSWWKFLVTDVTEGRQGNRERTAFIYDERKVRFSGLAGEIVLPPVKVDGATVGQNFQFARTPFICGFRAGWSKFNLCTVHIYYGKSVPEDPQRVREIQALAATLAKRSQAAGQPGSRIESNENMILLGDFNIFARDDVTFKALTEAGFKIPDFLQALEGSNADQNKFYDQIAFMIQPRRLDFTQRCGVFDFFNTVYRQGEGGGDQEAYAADMGEKYQQLTDDHKKATYFKQWRTYQMSDHLPLWVELKIDFGEEYLNDIAQGDAGGQE